MADNSEYWECTICTFHNSLFKAKCEMCGTPMDDVNNNQGQFPPQVLVPHPSDDQQLEDDDGFDDDDELSRLTDEARAQLGQGHDHKDKHQPEDDTD